LRIRNKFICILLCIILVLLSGCQNQSEQNYQLYTSDPDNMLWSRDTPSTETPISEEREVIDKTSGELTIYGIQSSFDWIVKEFNKEYPNIKVSFNETEGEFNGPSDYAAKISVDLMSGFAGDIISNGASLYRQLGKNDLLEDLYPYMENDPEFNKEDYYTNIFEAMEYDNKLLAVPMSFFNRLVRFNKTLLEENQIEAPESASVDYKSITDIYHKIAPNNDKLLITRYFGYDIFEETEYNRYFDEKQGRADFNSPEFINFLNEMKKIRWPSEGDLKLSRLNSAGEDYLDRADENDLCLIVSSWYQQERNASLFYEHPSNLTVPIPMSASNGDISFHCPDKILAISSSSKNKELAWKFIRFCIEEKPIDMLKDDSVWPVSGMPVNRNSTLKLLEKAFGEGKKEAVQTVDAWNLELNEGSFLSHSYLLLEAMRKITDEFYEGRITAEDCAEQIQERAEIYLKE
jgi:multiple sugar transport system substrate-binding protein